MPAVVCNGAIKETLPSNLAPLYIASLKSRLDLSGKFLKVSILQVFTLHSGAVPSLKLSVTDDQGDATDVLALGQAATDLSKCVKGDILCFLKFEVEKSPGHLQKPFLIVLDDTRDEKSLTWIFKETPSSVSVNPATVNVKYTYKALSDVEVNTIVDVYGVVKFYKAPIKSRGTDYFCVLSLVDPSLDDPDAKLTCNLFSPDVDKLPTLEVGNIIRFHRLKIKSYEGRLQGYNGPGFQWLAFLGSVKDRKSSSKNYTFEQHDEDKVKSLIEWWSKSKSTFVEVLRTKLGQARPLSFFNLVCQVIRMCDLDSSCKMLSVWDGTKFDGALRFVRKEEMTSVVLQNDMLMTCAKDWAVDVFIFDNHVKDASNIQPGDYILLTNLHASVVNGQVELTLHGGTVFSRKIEVLEESCEDVENLKSALLPLIQEAHSPDKQKGNPSSPDKQQGNPSSPDKQQGNPSSPDKQQGNPSSPDKQQGNPAGRHPKRTSKRKPDGSVGEGGEGAVPAKRSTCKKILKERSSKKTASGASNSNNSCRNLSSEFGQVQGRGTNLVTEDGFILQDSIESLSEIIVPVSHGTNKVSIDPDNEAESERSSDGSSQSQTLWASAYEDSEYETEMKKLRKSPHRTTQGNIQDESISSSGKFRERTLVKENKSQMVPPCNSRASSQETFHTAPSPSGYTRVAVDLQEEAISPKRNLRSAAVLSLKSQTNSPAQLNDPSNKKKRNKKTFSQCTMMADSLSGQDLTVSSFNDIKFAHESQDPTLNSGTYTIHYVEVSQNSLNSVNSGMLGNSSQLSDSHVTSSNEETGPTQEQLVKAATTIVCHHHIPVSTITQVLQHEPPFKFRVHAQVQDFSPRSSNPADLIYLFCESCCTAEKFSGRLRKDRVKKSLCENCQDKPTYREPTFIMTFELSDGHNSLLAYLHGQDAVQFFNGVIPSEMVSNKQKFDQLKKSLDVLCQSDSDLADRPLMECCLVSYKVGEDVKYKIFDTVLVQDF